ncbi:MAG: polyprenyl synthetase family protein, partial [Muribaculaceae bacterium]|nr:polyprenyl synthetase family protein [Muribaculaceae bacterium]
TFNKAAIEVYEGQQYDMEYEHRTDVTINQYINMIRLKTSVLFGCACQIGAIAAGANDTEQQHIYDFGINLGLAFQLQDDFLDVYGDAATFGKEIGGDILNAKRTFMLISAYNRANGDQVKQLDELLAHDTAYTPAQRIAGVTEIYNKLAIPELCRLEIARHTQVAIDAVQSLNIAPEAKQAFEELVEKLMKRSR